MRLHVPCVSVCVKFNMNKKKKRMKKRLIMKKLTLLVEVIYFTVENVDLLLKYHTHLIAPEIHQEDLKFCSPALTK